MANTRPKTDNPAGPASPSVFYPAVQLCAPADLLVLPEQVVETGARLKLRPAPQAMLRALNEACGGRWKQSSYFVDGALYCKLSLWDSAMQLWIERDAPNGGDYGHSKETPKAKAAGALYNAMLQFGFWSDVAALPVLTFGADQLHIIPVLNHAGKATGYHVGKLTVEELVRDDQGKITGVSLRDKNGGVSRWAR